MTEKPHPHVTLALSSSFRILEVELTHFVSFCVSGGFNYCQCQLALTPQSTSQNLLQVAPTGPVEAVGERNLNGKSTARESVGYLPTMQSILKFTGTIASVFGKFVTSSREAEFFGWSLLAKV